jgi:hypothetical protein
MKQSTVLNVEFNFDSNGTPRFSIKNHTEPIKNKNHLFTMKNKHYFMVLEHMQWVVNQIDMLLYVDLLIYLKFHVFYQVKKLNEKNLVPFISCDFSSVYFSMFLFSMYIYTKIIYLTKIYIFSFYEFLVFLQKIYIHMEVHFHFIIFIDRHGKCSIDNNSRLNIR